MKLKLAKAIVICALSAVMGTIVAAFILDPIQMGICVGVVVGAGALVWAVVTLDDHYLNQ